MNDAAKVDLLERTLSASVRERARCNEMLGVATKALQAIFIAGSPEDELWNIASRALALMATMERTQ